jgi:hypothetical protein
MGKDRGSDSLNAALFPDRQKDAELRLGNAQFGEVLIETGGHTGTYPRQGCTDPRR